MNFAQKMKSYRQKNNWTQQDIAERLNVSRKTISSWENSRSYPDIFMLVQISDLYRVSLDDLLREDHKMIDNYKQEHELNKRDKRNFIFSYVINVIMSVILLAKPVIMGNLTLRKFTWVLVLALIFNTLVLLKYIDWKRLKMKYGFYICWLVLAVMQFELTASSLSVMPGVSITI
ncbi:helix-turn-helix domain-containing protein [Limosilactobacillus vaginalis]|uniref:helix-turn-helix domain-containing protein n=1 Tax=Limosilactobacillus vaginalis TaxID=1633 RepID=UPI00242CD1F7|nr:helix-turn-helix transcriptional regulator [Limosilactobacillus vaginalis]